MRSIYFRRCNASPAETEALRLRGCVRPSSLTPYRLRSRLSADPSRITHALRTHVACFCVTSRQGEAVRDTPEVFRASNGYTSDSRNRQRLQTGTCGLHERVDESPMRCEQSRALDTVVCILVCCERCAPQRKRSIQQLKHSHLHEQPKTYRRRTSKQGKVSTSTNQKKRSGIP